MFSRRLPSCSRSVSSRMASSVTPPSLVAPSLEISTSASMPLLNNNRRNLSTVSAAASRKLVPVANSRSSSSIPFDLRLSGGIPSSMSSNPLLATQFQVRHNSSFMRRILDQVQKDLEKSEGYQKARKDFKDAGGDESAEKLKQKALEQEENLRKLKEATEKTSESTSSYFKAMRASAKEQQEKLKSQMEEQGKKIDETDNEFLKKSKEVLGQVGEVTGEGLEKAKGVFGAGLNKISGALGRFEGEKAESHRKWKEGQSYMKSYQEKMKNDPAAQKEAADKAAAAKESAESGSEESESKTAAKDKDSAAADSTKADSSADNALVVREETSWDKFGASMRDMPLLHGMLENPLFDRILGETEIAQSVREMKELMPQGFRMVELHEEVEHVIAPAIVKAYLEGNSEFLQLHCGEAAYRAVDASIQERKKNKVELDQDLRVPPCEITLAGARAVDVGAGYRAPIFVFTFQAQQINCLTSTVPDKETGEYEVKEGALDDIRNVFYAIALTRHPLALTSTGGSSMEEEETREYRKEYINELRKTAKKMASATGPNATGAQAGSGQGSTTSAGDEPEEEIVDEFSKLDATDLEFPWLISELAVVGNQQVW